MPVRMNAKLEPADVEDIKRNLWLGHRQADIATAFGISQTTVSRILRGEQYFDIPWPSGEVGPLPERRIREIQLSRTGGRRSLGEVSTNRLVAGPAIRSGSASHSGSPQPSTVAPIEENDDGMDSSARPAGSDGPSDADTQGAQTGRDSPSSVVPGPDGAGDVSDGQNLTTPGDDDDLVERFKTDQEARAKAIAALGEEADQEMQDELAAIMSHAEGSARAATEQPKPKGKPKYDLLPWEQVLEHGDKLPVVRAARDNEALQHCVRAAFKMLPRSQWSSRRALVLVREVAESLDIDLNKELSDDQQE